MSSSSVKRSGRRGGKLKRAREEQRKQEEDLDALSCGEIRKRLLDLGESPGPIDTSNKSIYVRQLVRKRLKHETTESSSTSPLSSHPSPPPSHSSPPPPPSHSGAFQSSVLGRSPPVKKVDFSPLGSRHSPVSTPTVRRPLQHSSVQKQVPRVSLAVKPSVLESPSTRDSIADFEVDGLVAATLTPFNSDGELNLSVLPQYCNHLWLSGVRNIFVNGTTGESLSLTVEERKLILEEWIKIVPSKMNVIAHVGTESLKNTCSLAMHAEDMGAHAIGVMPTTFFKPATVEHLVLYLEKVAESAPSTPMFYYHIPSMTGVNLSMEEFLSAASDRLPTLRGLKFTDKNLFEFGRCVSSNGGRYQVIYGCDEQLLAALSFGGTAAIGSTYNFAGRLYNRLLASYHSGDMKKALLEQRRSQDMIKLLFKYGGHAGALKAFMKLQGVDVGPPRLPLLSLSLEATRTLSSDLRVSGFFDWA